MINIQNKDYKESLKWFLVIYLHPADKNQARIRRNGKDFARKFELKDSELEIFTKYRKKILSASVFLVMKIKKKSQSTFQKLILRVKLIYY